MTITETLRIKNFAGIKEAEIELSRMNVFIGPQASGKSVCAKLLFYFKEMIRRMAAGVADDRTKHQIRAEDRDRFLKYFPAANWSKGNFQIDYSYGDFQVEVARNGTESASIKITYSKYYDSLLRIARQAFNDSNRVRFNLARFQIMPALSARASASNALLNDSYFIPASRSFFSALRGSVFTLIANDVRIDPFVAEFGSIYEISAFNYHSALSWERNQTVDRVQKHLANLLCGIYQRIKHRDFIVSEDGRQVAVENSSSGQQEVLPLALVLASLAITGERMLRSTVFVEEPEAHLYPTAQREIVHLLAAVTDLSSNEASGQYVITTHSPYILSALNNLMYGAQIAQQSPDKRAHVTRILGDAALVAPANVRAYAFGDGKIESIIDADTGLVKATVLDSVSNDLAREFEALVDVEFEEKAA